MTLRLKINLIVGLLTLLFTAAVLALEWRSLHDSVNEEVVAANRVATQLLERVSRRFGSQGTVALVGFLQGMGRVRSTEIALLNSYGEELYRSPPSLYKVGRDAPEWFERLITPKLATQAIDFPDGKLIVRASASRAALDAWDDAVRLSGIALALLVAVNALVFWLVGRAVRPFAEIVTALNQLKAGRFDVALPKLAGTEAAAIGSAFNRMVGELRGHIDTERRAARAEHDLSANRELTRWIDQHVEAERRLIARELHDELGQSVTAMRSMALSIAQRSSGVDAEAKAAASVIADESSRLYDAMHGIIPRLAPLVLDSFGLTEALADLVERTRRSQPGLVFDTNIALSSQQALPAEVALTLYRSAQEGITNALSHGQAKHLWLSMQADNADVRLQLRDDGIGLPPTGWQRPGHYGLRWLIDRIETQRGDLRIEANQPKGVQLLVRMPLTPTQEASP